MSSKTRDHRIVQTLVGGILLNGLLGIVLLYAATYQRPIAKNDGKGWDGATYFSIAEQFQSGLNVSGPGPFCYRILTPLAVGKLFPGDLMRGFFFVNLVGVVLSTNAIWIFLQSHSRALQTTLINLSLVAYYVLLWNAPPRFHFFYPCSIEPWFAFFAVLALVSFPNRRGSNTWLAKTIFVIVCFLFPMLREVGAVVCCCAFLKPGPFVYRRKQIYFSPRRLNMLAVLGFIAIIGSIFVTRTIADQTNSYSYLYEVSVLLYQFRPVPFVHAWYYTFGLLLLVSICDWRPCLVLLYRHQHLTALMVCLVILSIIGGGDYEKFIHWLAPALLLVISKSLDSQWQRVTRPLVAVPLVAALLLTARIPYTVPDGSTAERTPKPILAVQSSHGNPLHLTAYYGGYTRVGYYGGFEGGRAISFMQYLLISMWLVGCLCSVRWKDWMQTIYRLMGFNARTQPNSQTPEKAARQNDRNECL